MNKSIELPIWVGAREDDFIAANVYLYEGGVEVLPASQLRSLPSYHVTSPDDVGDQWLADLGDTPVALALRGRGCYLVIAIDPSSRELHHLEAREEQFCQADSKTHLQGFGVNMTDQVAELARWYFNQGFAAGMAAAEKGES